nr:hypothetical protein [Rhodococcus qingshengii]
MAISPRPVPADVALAIVAASVLGVTVGFSWTTGWAESRSEPVPRWCFRFVLRTIITWK